MPTTPDQLESALVWGQMGPQSAPSGWVLVQGWRRPGEGRPWQRAVINRELSAPLAHPRPGEDAHGTWHGYQEYDRPPTSRDACDFASVDFLTRDSAWRRLSGGFRMRNWIRAIGESPVCAFPETTDTSRR